MAIIALTEPGHEAKAYTPTGPEVITMGDIVRSLSHAASRKVCYVHAPEVAQRLSARFILGFGPRDVEACRRWSRSLRTAISWHAPTTSSG